ncbi:hypothetical protein KY289_001378 [Solanum tuberosum]|nr:hypothetical protein KY289_001378 [Solanum tuberosum]
MDFSGRVNGLGIKLLNHSNYKVWKTCMESYLLGEDLWDVVNGNDTSPPNDGPKNCSAYKKLKQINAKAEFILKKTISSGLFDHIIKCKSAHEIRRTLDRLFNKKNEARLQILENELDNTAQGNLSISEYFLKIKNLCSEICLLNSEEAISEARMRRIVICGLKPEYIPFLTLIQGWTQQPSLEEFEILLSSQELLAKQLVSVFVKDGEGDALVDDERNFIGKEGDMPHSRSSGGSRSPREKKESYNYYSKKPLRCYCCGKVGLIKRYCRAEESNMAQKVAEEEEECEKCLVAEARAIDAMISINLEKNWIEDLEYNIVDHVEKQETELST